MEFTVKEVAAWRVASFLIEVLHQIYFLGIYQIFNINNSSNLDYQMWFKQGISLDDSNFDMENYYSLVDVKKKGSFNKKFNEKCIKYPIHYNVSKYV